MTSTMQQAQPRKFTQALSYLHNTRARYISCMHGMYTLPHLKSCAKVIYASNVFQWAIVWYGVQHTVGDLRYGNTHEYA